MKSNRRITIWAMLILGCLSVSSTGCLFGDNLSVNVVVPLGLGGAPGAYNPFGLTQALINSLIGGGTTTTTTTTSAGSTVPNGSFNAGVVPAATNPTSSNP